MRESFVAEIHLVNTDAGGRSGRLLSGEWRTVFGIDNEHWSVRMLFTGAPAPEDVFQTDVELLVPPARQYFSSGVEFTVWEGGTKGVALVLSVAV